MVIGKTVQIYLPDGNPKSIRICDINTSFVKGVLIPRNKLPSIKNFENISKPGVYFLISDDDELNTFRIYIGEAEDLFNRLKQHDKPDKEWNKAICFVSDKGNLNKAHYKFLENHCFQKAKEVDRFKIMNSLTPTQSSLSNQDRDLSLYFFEDLNFILETLGYPVFNKIKAISEDIFFCKGKEADASGNLTEEGFVVYKGSVSNLEEAPSAGSWLINMREKLMWEVLVKEGNILKFEKDFIFNSPSAAAGIVLGRRANGWTEWKTKDGRTLDELKRQED